MLTNIFYRIGHSMPSFVWGLYRGEIRSVRKFLQNRRRPIFLQNICDSQHLCQPASLDLVCVRRVLANRRFWFHQIPTAQSLVSCLRGVPFLSSSYFDVAKLVGGFYRSLRQAALAMWCVKSVIVSRHAWAIGRFLSVASAFSRDLRFSKQHSLLAFWCSITFFKAILSRWAEEESTFQRCDFVELSKSWCIFRRFFLFWGANYGEKANECCQ